ncbi:MAG TPA: DUF2299 family protein [Methanothrix sp.]|nr:DUF2299 family protein [Methanothrix sp.]
MPVNDVPSAINLINGWMKQRGISSSGKTEPTPSGVFFEFICKDVTGMPFAIIQPETWEKTVLVISEVAITDGRFKSIELLTPEDRDDFLYNLQQDSSLLPAPFALDPTFEETGIPRGIQFNKEICYDGLTEDRLNDVVRDVVRSALFVIRTIRKKFGNPKKD